MMIMMMVTTSPPAPPSVFLLHHSIHTRPRSTYINETPLLDLFQRERRTLVPKHGTHETVKGSQCPRHKETLSFVYSSRFRKRIIRKIGVKLQQHLASGKSVTRRLSFIWNLIEQLDSERICSWTGNTATSLLKTKQIVEFPHGLPAWQHLSTQIGHLFALSWSPVEGRPLHPENMELNKPIEFWMELCRNM